MQTLVTTTFDCILKHG